MKRGFLNKKPKAEKKLQEPSDPTADPPYASIDFEARSFSSSSAVGKPSTLQQQLVMRQNWLCYSWFLYQPSTANLPKDEKGRLYMKHTHVPKNAAASPLIRALKPRSCLQNDDDSCPQAGARGTHEQKTTS